jgi:hypothetical protein
LGTGIALTTLLPVFGSDTEQSREGYYFTDPWRRDSDAWALAKSDHGVWEGLQTGEFFGDQYGGMMTMSALAYRYLSPDIHRPVLIILMAALVSAMAVPFLWKAADTVWGTKIAIPAAWILALYPEAILLGGSQMREPFLITFIAMTIWGFVDWLKNRHGLGWIWFAGGIAGMLLFSPVVALLALIVTAGWYWFSGEHRRFSGWLAVVLGLVFIAGIFLASSALGETTLSANNPYSILTTWFYDASKWDLYLLTESSGMVQYLLGVLPKPLHAPFLAGYGIAQPVLPANLFEPTIAISRIIGSLRALGWYALLPLLLYGLIAAWKSPDPHQRRVWLWLGFVIWIWIVLVSIRAGADQWDNPRYRVIMLPWQALLAAHAWSFWREARDRWLPRIAAVEISFVVVFSLWYLGRYYHVVPKFNFMAYAVFLLGLGTVIILGDVLYDRYRSSRS